MRGVPVTSVNHLATYGVLSSGDTLILVGPSGISGRLDELGTEA